MTKIIRLDLESGEGCDDKVDITADHGLEEVSFTLLDDIWFTVPMSSLIEALRELGVET